MIIIRIGNRIFFIHQLYFDGLVVILFFLIGKTIKARFGKKKSNKINPNLRGGDLSALDAMQLDYLDLKLIMEKCLVEPGIYAVMQQKVKDLLRKIVNDYRKDRPLLITAPLFILGQLVSQRESKKIVSITGTIFELAPFGVKVVKYSLASRRIIVDSILGLLLSLSQGSILILVGMVFVLGTIRSPQKTLSSINCEEIVRLVQPLEPLPEPTYLQIPKNINDQLDQVLVIHSGPVKIDPKLANKEQNSKSKIKEFCVIDTLDGHKVYSRETALTISERVKRMGYPIKRIDPRGIPLSDRTKTLDSVQRFDDTETRTAYNDLMLDLYKSKKFPTAEHCKINDDPN